MGYGPNLSGLPDIPVWWWWAAAAAVVFMLGYFSRRC